MPSFCLALTIAMFCMWGPFRPLFHAARLLVGAKNSHHISPILASLKWLPVDLRIQFCYMFFKAVHGMAPASVSDLIALHQAPRFLRSSYMSLLAVP